MPSVHSDGTRDSSTVTVPDADELSFVVLPEHGRIGFSRHAPSPSRRFLPVAIYASVVLLTCAWVLSLPVFPSQDGPLHLYYADIFRQLLAHQPGVYSGTYRIRNLLPPYAAYYYGLLALGHVVSLEMADKLFACISIGLLAWGGRTLVRTVSPRSAWAPFLLLPVLLNWPLLMGFANYMLGVSLACFALAAWWRGPDRMTSRGAVSFLAWIAAITLTHPVPWMFVMGFLVLDLSLRCAQLHGQRGGLRTLRTRSVAFACACLPAIYFARFRAPTRVVHDALYNPSTGLRTAVPSLKLPERMQIQGGGLIHTLGLQLFLGPGLSHLYRLTLRGIFWLLLILGVRRLLRGRTWRRWTPGHIAVLYGFCLVLCILVVPDDFGGGYFFVTRLQILLWLTLLVGAAGSLQWLPRLTAALAAASTLLCLITLVLATRYIAPVARHIAALDKLPVIESGTRPGLLLRPVGVVFPAHLNFDSYNWAPAFYFRRHHLILFTTAWLGEPLIPVGLRPGTSSVDTTFFNQAPEFGTRLMPNDLAARRLLDRASFAIMQREDISRKQNPFSERSARGTPGAFAAGWTCTAGYTSDWYLCLPGAQ